MKLIGYWMESLLDRRGLPLVEELVGSWPGRIRSAVCDYLMRGEVFEVYRLGWRCHFGCELNHGPIAYRELTDGEWVWPESLVHYVELHGVVLPEEFVRSAISGREPVASPSGKAGSLDFWIEWSSRHRSAQFRAQLEEARKAADLASRETTAKALQDGIERILGDEKESEAKCVWAGCDRRALVGRAICARHMLSDEDLHRDDVMIYRIPKFH